MLLFVSMNALSGEATDVNVKKHKQITIQLESYDESEFGDRVVLRYWHTLLGVSTANYTAYDQVVGKKNQLGNLEFIILPQEEFGYFCLGTESDGNFKTFLYFYLAEAGDNIFIDLQKTDAYTELQTFKQWNAYYSGYRNFSTYKAAFSGKGSEKYRCRYTADSLSLFFKDDNLINKSTRSFNFQNNQDRARNLSLEIVKQYERQLSPLAYGLLMSDIYGRSALEKYRMLKWDVPTFARENNGYQELKALHEFIFKIEIDEPWWLRYRNLSPFYLESRLEYITYTLLDEGFPSPKIILEEIMDQRNVLQKERLLCLLLFTYRDKMNDQYEAYQLIQKTIDQHELRRLLNGYAQRFIRGALAFSFELEGSDGNTIKKEDFHGSLLIMDFWFTGCTGCVNFFQATLSHLEKEYKHDPRINFLSVSIDRDRDRWLKSVDSNLYTSKKSVNVFTNGEGADHELIRFYNIQFCPKIIIINGNGELHGIYQQTQISSKKIKEILAYYETSSTTH